MVWFQPELNETMPRPGAIFAYKGRSGRRFWHHSLHCAWGGGLIMTYIQTPPLQIKRPPGKILARATESINRGDWCATVGNFFSSRKCEPAVGGISNCMGTDETNPCHPQHRCWRIIDTHRLESMCRHIHQISHKILDAPLLCDAPGLPSPPPSAQFCT